MPQDGEPTIEVREGAREFSRRFTPADGLGPLFNAESCAFCHLAGGMGSNGLATAIHVARSPNMTDAVSVAQLRSVAELGFPCDLEPGIPSGTTVTSVRNSPDLHGLGLLENVSDGQILQLLQTEAPTVRGRINWAKDSSGRLRAGRFGWKGSVATLTQMTANAFRNELGMASAFAGNDIRRKSGNRARCEGENDRLDEVGRKAGMVAEFVASLPAPPPRYDRAGEKLFERTGCAGCHSQQLVIGSNKFRPLSDLLLHDVGSELGDGISEGLARGNDWRTTPLWGLGSRKRLLHDGRALTIEQAVMLHGGQAAPARTSYVVLSEREKAVLLGYLKKL